MVYEDAKGVCHHYIPIKVLADLVAGGFAGFCSVMANNPIDVVKTNMQGLEAKKYGSVTNCFSHILKHEGVGGFYKGVAPRLARVILDVALTFSIFGALKRQISAYLN
jgi:solute carrier family 25 citrate transporter 1